MDVLPLEIQQEIVVLFKKDKTVREIAALTGYDEKEVLLWLTKNGYWSKYCSECVLKRCYDCKGLYELGQPIGVQDQIDLKVTLGGKNDGKDTRQPD